MLATLLTVLFFLAGLTGSIGTFIYMVDEASNKHNNTPWITFGLILLTVVLWLTFSQLIRLPGVQ